MGIRGPGQQLGQSGLPGAAYRPGKNELSGEAGRQESLRKERGEERGDKGSDGKTKAAFPRGQ